MTDPQRQRCRLTFAKCDPMRFTGHLDLHHTWERMLRRAGAPVAHTQGFNPRQRISLGLALPLGFTSECELIDVWLEEPMPPEKLQSDLAGAAPPGLIIRAVRIVDQSEPSLQKQMLAATYEVFLHQDAAPPDLSARVDELLNSPEIQRQRRGKDYDLRPLVESLETRQPDGAGATLLMRLAARDGATGRPEEVLLSLDLDPLAARIHRTKIHLEGKEN
jgi:radical SAM-linked protein